MTEARLFVAYLGLLLIAVSIGALLGAAAGRDARMADQALTTGLVAREPAP